MENNARTGIAIAGNLIADHVKMIDRWPRKGMLCNIMGEHICIGGCAGNTSVDLAIIDQTVPLTCYGRVGQDEDGEFIVKLLEEKGIMTEHIQYSETEATSFTDVMTDQRTGERTFFYEKGANKEFLLSDEEIDSIQSGMFHIGYALLLDSMDEYDEVYGSTMAKVLCRIQEKGIKTSMDVVSEEGLRFQKVVPPCLQYCNYFIANEIEGGEIAGITPRDSGGEIEESNIKKILRKILDMGVRDLAVLHSPEGGFALDSKGNYWNVPSFHLPEGFIKGSVGAGDAFCAGMLYALYKEYPVEQGIRLANLAAACNLSEQDSMSGMRCLSEMKELQNKLEK